MCNETPTSAEGRGCLHFLPNLWNLDSCIHKLEVPTAFPSTGTGMNNEQGGRTHSMAALFARWQQPVVWVLPVTIPWLGSLSLGPGCPNLLPVLVAGRPQGAHLESGCHSLMEENTFHTHVLVSSPYSGWVDINSLYIQLKDKSPGGATPPALHCRLMIALWWAVGAHGFPATRPSVSSTPLQNTGTCGLPHQTPALRSSSQLPLSSHRLIQCWLQSVRLFLPFFQCSFHSSSTGLFCTAALYRL